MCGRRGSRKSANPVGLAATELAPVLIVRSGASLSQLFGLLPLCWRPGWQIIGSVMTQAKLRFYDTDEKKEVGSTPLDKVPMIPRVGETVILPEGSGDPAAYKVTGVKHEY